MLIVTAIVTILIGLACDAPKGPGTARTRAIKNAAPKDTISPTNSAYLKLGWLIKVVQLFIDCENYVLFRSMRAGFPATTVFGGTSRVTTAPAPTRTLSPIVTPPSIVAFEPIDALRQTRVSTQCQSSCPLISPCLFVAAGSKSLINITPCATMTSSSIVTPSQMNV